MMMRVMMKVKKNQVKKKNHNHLEDHPNEHNRHLEDHPNKHYYNYLPHNPLPKNKHYRHPNKHDHPLPKDHPNKHDHDSHYLPHHTLPKNQHYRYLSSKVVHVYQLDFYKSIYLQLTLFSVNFKYKILYLFFFSFYYY